MADLRAALRKHAQARGLPFWLRNGDLPFFAPIWNGIEEAARLIMEYPGYRAPNTLKDWERVARTLIVPTSQFYRVMYGAGAPLIGNKVHVVSLPWP